MNDSFTGLPTLQIVLCFFDSGTAEGKPIQIRFYLKIESCEIWQRDIHLNFIDV